MQRATEECREHRVQRAWSSAESTECIVQRGGRHGGVQRVHSAEGAMEECRRHRVQREGGMSTVDTFQREKVSTEVRTCMNSNAGPKSPSWLTGSSTLNTAIRAGVGFRVRIGIRPGVRTAVRTRVKAKDPIGCVSLHAAKGWVGR